MTRSQLLESIDRYKKYTKRILLLWIGFGAILMVLLVAFLTHVKVSLGTNAFVALAVGMSIPLSFVGFLLCLHRRNLRRFGLLCPMCNKPCATPGTAENVLATGRCTNCRGKLFDAQGENDD